MAEDPTTKTTSRPQKLRLVIDNTSAQPLSCNDNESRLYGYRTAEIDLDSENILKNDEILMRYGYHRNKSGTWGYDCLADIPNNGKP